jgi:hypothetical protein
VVSALLNDDTARIGAAALKNEMITGGELQQLRIHRQRRYQRQRRVV